MHRIPTLLIALFAAALVALPSSADVVVIANRTRHQVAVRITPTNGAAYPLNLASGQVTPLFSDSPLILTYATAGGANGFRLDANSAYYIGESTDGLSVHKIGLGGEGGQAHARALPGGGPTTPAGVINVIAYVDEEEPTRDAQWQRKIRDRIQRASDILLAHSGMTLRLTGFGTWNSDNATRDFEQSLREFEQEAFAPPGGLAIGFSSQYHVVRGRTHVGGTRGPLSSHVLLREWSKNVSENDRLELLVHELGHYLGASHSPEPDSVMRPVLRDQVSRLAAFDIRFDPINTLVMSMVGEEVRRRGVSDFAGLTPATRRRLNQVYGTLAKALPGDSSAAHFAARTEQGKNLSHAKLVRRVVESITQAAAENQQLAPHDRLTGDALTELLVRRAAAEAIALREHAAKPLLLGLAIAFDDSATLRALPATGALVRETDPPGALSERNRLLASATLMGRRDLLKHFFVSGALCAALDAQQAHALGLAKEVLDSHRASGFSFADLAADRAGVRFGQGVLAGKITPVALADDYSVVRYMPLTDGLPEGLSADAFAVEYGSTTDKRFLNSVSEMDARINALTGFEQ